MIVPAHQNARKKIKVTNLNYSRLKNSLKAELSTGTNGDTWSKAQKEPFHQSAKFWKAFDFMLIIP